MSGNFICRHDVQPRVKLYSPREESFPIPLKYIDVSRTTHTNFDVMQERRIDDYWNTDGSRDLSDSWTGFTHFSLSEQKLQDGFFWSGRRLTKRQVTSRRIVAASICWWHTVSVLLSCSRTSSRSSGLLLRLLVRKEVYLSWCRCGDGRLHSRTRVFCECTLECQPHEEG